MPEDPVGYHVFVSVKALNTECLDPVLFVSYCERVRKIPRTSKTDDSLNNENVRYMHLGQLCSRSFGLGVGLLTKLCNNTMYQCREN